MFENEILRSLMSTQLQMYKNKNSSKKDKKECEYLKKSLHVKNQINFEYFCGVPNVAKMMKMKILLLFMTIAFSSDLHLVKCSQILVENGVYSRVTVQIEPQPQPADCVDFLDKLEVGKTYLFIFLLESFEVP